MIHSHSLRFDSLRSLTAGHSLETPIPERVGFHTGMITPAEADGGLDRRRWDRVVGAAAAFGLWKAAKSRRVLRSLGAIDSPEGLAYDSVIVRRVEGPGTGAGNRTAHAETVRH